MTQTIHSHVHPISFLHLLLQRIRVSWCPHAQDYYKAHACAKTHTHTHTHRLLSTDITNLRNIPALTPTLFRASNPASPRTHFNMATFTSHAASHFTLCNVKRYVGLPLQNSSRNRFRNRHQQNSGRTELQAQLNCQYGFVSN
jgi:hypothetical protein